MWGSIALDATRAVRTLRALPGLERADFPLALLLSASFALQPGLRTAGHEACQKVAASLSIHGIRVNAIAPGEIDTSILSPGTEEIVAKQIPLHRLGTPDEVAKIIYVLCTDTSSYVNGAEIHINGGQHV